MHADESGHFSFSAKASRFFSIGYACTYKQPFVKEEVVTRALRKINQRRSNRRKISEFKFTHDSVDTKNKFLTVIKNMNIDLGVICIEKKPIENKFENKGELFYKSSIINVITTVMTSYFSEQDSSNSIEFVLDKRLPKSRIEKFDQYCKKKACEYMSNLHSQINYDISIRHENSRTVKMIQVADYVAGSVQLKFERKNSQFYDMLRPMIKYNNIPNE